MEMPKGEEENWTSVPPPPPQYYPPVQPYPVMREAPDPLAELKRAFKSLLWTSGSVSYLAMMVISVIILFALTPSIQEWITTPASDTGELPSDILFLILPVPVGLVAVSGLGFQIWHIIILGMFGACFFYSIYNMYQSWTSKGNSPLKSLTNPDKAKSGLEGAGKLFMAVTFFSVFYFLFIEAGGVTTETPGFEELDATELLYRLFSAAVYEEIVSRILLIGAPLLLIALLFRWKPPYHKFLLGGGMRLNLITLFLILFSSLIFAFAHVQSWDMWKVPQVFVSGMALGYAFVAYGVYSSILLHFSVNFVASALITLWPDEIGLELGVGVIFLVWFFAGAYFLGHYFVHLGRKMMEIMKVKPARPSGQTTAYTYQQPPQAGPPYGAYQHQPQQVYRGYICPNCGNTNAGYESGALVCMRCGHITR